MSELKFNLSNTRALLTKLDHLPKKQLGQNFLIDNNILSKSLQMAELTKDDTVVEIGPGLGCLTSAMLDVGSSVYAVEKDPALANHLRGNFGQLDKFDLIEGDAIKTPKGGLPKETKSYKVIANLPYAISTPWLSALLENEQLPKSMVLMLQKEAGSRFTADPGTKNYGAITIFLKSAFCLVASHKVSQRCFYPVPKVDSVLVHLARKEEAVHLSSSTRKTIRGLFTQRRKQIGNLCRQIPDNEKLQAWLAYISQNGHSPKSRPEELPLEVWHMLDQDDLLKNSYK